MSTQLAVVPTTGELVQIEEWTDARKEFIRKAFCGGAPDDIAATFLGLCERRRLSPEARHVYLVNRAKKGDTPNWVIQTGIDGYRLIADRTGRYAGCDDPTFQYSDDRREIVRATVTVYKMVSGQRCPFTASARWDEYSAGGPMWNKMPHTMLAKCAEALALRKAFPEELSGMYTDVEIDQSESPVNVGPKPVQRSRAASVAVSAGPSEPVEVIGWTEFWKRLRERKIDADTFQSIVNKPAKSFANPMDALKALADREAEIAAEQDEDVDDEPDEMNAMHEGWGDRA